MTETTKSFDHPDELVRFPGITENLVEIAGMTVARTVQEPGWRWSTHMQPVVGGEWCEARHIGAVVSGRWGAILRDGSVLEFGPNDVYDVGPGHDGYTIGDEPVVMVEWAGMRALIGLQGEFSDRVLATLLFTDLVESTETLKRLGDVAWRELLAIHHQAAASEIERFGGRVVDIAGDGMLAVFDAPARALRCASAISAAASRQGLRVRAGVHAGEVATVGSDVQGVAVYEAARIMATAEPDEILVSDTIPVLVSGLGLQFVDRGDCELKGIGRRRLFAFSG
jgi:class 3 adenylate cyclase